MLNKMLIDASHPEETRVIVTRGNKIEEFDFESEHKKQLKGNIYLARVTRVEPSLQAAFVEYGGNRHGFLAFSEIHPDYYQIPAADRQALMEAEAAAAAANADNDDDDHDEQPQNNAQGSRSDRHDRRRGNRRRNRRHDNGAAKNAVPAAEPVGPAFVDYVPGTPAVPHAIHLESVSEPADDFISGNHDDDDHDSDDENDTVESVGSEDAMEELPTHNRVHRRQYNIQEVIKRRQILLVQVVKEERGNKGAALTTYLSLAGRYSVLMPNTARGGGISRKITNIQDRKRLKDIVKELEVPQGMGVILRTAGANRTKAEVRRDYEYLMRMWENVRNLTLQSVAPALVYEEGSLIKRSIRDLYNKDISEILVAGEEGYREAKEFMRMLMPSHARVVQPYREQLPIFARNGIEAQLDRMLLPQVTLKSGGYIIINQTEALVAIDVNSGRSTRENSIEETALQTNLEAAEEVARQLRLRDLAGLIVVDFIDMEEKRNNRAVEKKMKDCLKDDRARIQVGRISHFGLLEMSRQRIRASVLESTMQICPHCGGTGHIRSDSSMALHVIRAVEDYLMRNSGYDISVRTPAATALYVLNHKRQLLSDLEARFGLNIHINADESVGVQNLVIDKGTPSTRPITMPALQPADYYDDGIEDPELPAEADEIEAEAELVSSDKEETNGNDNDRRRRRRRRRRGERDNHADSHDTDAQSDDENERDGHADHAASSGHSDDDQRKKRRRGRRGGRKNRRDDGHYNNLPAAELIGDWTELLAAAEAKRQAAKEAAEKARNVPPAEPVPGPAPVAAVTVEASVSAKVEAGKPEATKTVEAAPIAEKSEEKTKKPARRRTTKVKTAVTLETAPVADEKAEAVEVVKTAEVSTESVAEDVVAEEKPVRKPRARKTAAKDKAAEKAPVEAAEKSTRKPRTRKTKAEDAIEAPENVPVVGADEPQQQPIVETVEPITVPVNQPQETSQPVITSSDNEAAPAAKRSGWWQKKSFF
ncbi:Rne/Rng family ribonuclease [Paenochrobactrum pullorum]|uniref:Rne/Rng family ribonuclease n=1 Tax=Paenochrobactrum pullorum TaxID=1324351 RepID=UPI0035BBF049